MKTFKLAALAALIVVACGAFAQGRGGRGFGGQRGGLSNPTMLLNRADVKSDLQLSDDQKVKLQEVLDKMRAARGGRRGGGNGGGAGAAGTAGAGTAGAGAGGGGGRGANRTPPTPEEMAARQKMMDDVRSQVNAILTPDQARRLKEIAYQLAGVQAVSDKDTAAAIGLSAEQKAQIDDLVKKQNEANAALRSKASAGEIDRTELRPRMQKNREILTAEIGKVLTDAQKAKLKDLGGAKPFVPDQQPGG